ncbi:tannase/feruloyl esterase family alpha/beta hydrolase [Roseomonas chloroacetimidivorans]|uniref:tannase/feruloyl esterase family alpha/beta hydrolase n=1 Tax=Roseomonas chloroacetimidivorans TaxID=1766656 RepID=UPI003C783B62
MKASMIALAGIGLALAGGAAAQGDPCAFLASPGSFSAAEVTAARTVPAEPATGTPAHCEVTAVARPVEGSRIGVVLRLPEAWNGRLLGVGGGGFAGDVSLESARPALSRGYAVAGTDTGHASPDTLDPSWALRPDGTLDEVAVTDFGHRSIHAMTVLAREAVRRRYGRVPDRAYFQGCSTGGRQGLAAVQRYPEDYDGVIAGAPVYNTVVYTGAVLRTQMFHRDPGANLMAAQVPVIAEAVQRACDGLDGVRDGVLTDPRRCSWDPAELQCGRTSEANCLSERQVETVRQIYRGVTTADGRVVAAPMMRGAETDWVDRSVGTPRLPLGRNAMLGAPFVSVLVMQDRNYDLMRFDPALDLPRVDRSIVAREVAMTEADIRRFTDRGGKLLLWHGYNDPGPSPTQTIAYFDRVRSALGADAAEKVRLFLAPGVFHCRGGPGWDRFDALSAMEEWVERGVLPERIIATRARDRSSRPICPYPQVARYDGSGDPDDAASFACADPQDR